MIGAYGAVAVAGDGAVVVVGDASEEGGRAVFIDLHRAVEEAVANGARAVLIAYDTAERHFVHRVGWKL